MRIQTEDFETIRVLVYPDSETGEIVLSPLIETDGLEHGAGVETRLDFDEAVQVAEKLNKIVNDKREGRW